LLVMAGLVPAIRGDTAPRRVAGTSPATSSVEQRYAVAFRLSAFFTASSMVPTM
jgi:hypothetical protein